MHIYHSQSPPKIIDRSVIGTPALASSRNESRTPAAVAARSATIRLGQAAHKDEISSQRGQNRQTDEHPLRNALQARQDHHDCRDVADRIAEEQGDRHQQ